MHSTNLSDAERDSLFKTLWNRSLVGVAILDRDGRFHQANPAFCAVVEYSEPELQAKRWQDITHPEDLAPAISLTQDIAEGRRDGYVMKKRYISKTGQVVWVVMSAERLEVAGVFHYFVKQISEVLPVHQPPAPVVVARKPLLEPLLKLIRENYPWVIILLGAVAYTVAEVLKRI